MNAQDRIPLATRLLRPRFARDVAYLAAEHRRAGIQPLPADRRTELELECEAGRRRVADRRVTRRSARLRRVTAAGLRRVRRARSSMAELAGSEGAVVRLHGRAMSVAEVRARAVAAAAVADTDGRARRLDRASRPLRVVGAGLLLADATALLVVIGFLLNIDWARPDPATLVTVVALSLFGAAVQVVLALHLGRRLWAWRHADHPDAVGREFPPRSAVILLGGGLLTTISTFAAGAIYLRIEREGNLADAGDLAGALGLLLAACAVVAPWILVADETYGPGPEARLVSAAGRILARAERRRRRQDRRARRRLAAAARRLSQADWLLADTVHRVGRDHLVAHRTLLAARGLAWGTTTCSAAELFPAPEPPDVAGVRSVLPMVIVVDLRCLTPPVERLRAELAAAWADYPVVVRDLDVDQLDLAG